MTSAAKIFGIGLSKTGTSSLNRALLRLGYRAIHYPCDRVTRQQLLQGDFRLKVLEHVDALTDSPIVPFFRSLDRLYPGSRFILTVRDLEGWLDSAERHWRRYPVRRPDDPRIPARLALFGTVGFNREHFADVWRQHHQAVRDYFRGREQDLLELDICGGAGWEPLCRFLGHPVPDEPFPHANKGVDPAGELASSAEDRSLARPTTEAAAAPHTGEGGVLSAASPPSSAPSASHKPRLLFASYHCLMDPSSGAARSARDLLKLLAGRGWPCRAFCGPQLDFEAGVPVAQTLADQGWRWGTRSAPVGEAPFSVAHAQDGDFPVTVYLPSQESPSLPPGRAESQAFLALLERLLQRERPDLMLTYGGQWVAREAIARAKRHGVRVVFWLRNFAYPTADPFRGVDGLIVPSAYAKEHYRRTLNLGCTAIPSPLDWARLRCEAVEGRYVTFVNPQPVKGVFVFARIAHELWHRRPDIPLLVVEGRAEASWLGRTGLDLSGLGNLSVMANTPDPRDFYRVSRLVLMPSVWQEPSGRVAAEALLNGIPVLASSRGGLPETLARAGFLFDIPEQYTPESRLVPTASEVAPWVETIIRLWDDPALYEEERRRCLQAAEAWRPEKLAEDYEAFFGRLLAPT